MGDDDPRGAAGAMNEPGRTCSVADPMGQGLKVFATGIRNPVGIGGAAGRGRVVGLSQRTRRLG